MEKKYYVRPNAKFCAIDAAEDCLAAVSIDIVDDNVDDSGKAKASTDDGLWSSSVWDD